MKHEILIIENLTNLDNLPHDVFTLFALPLKIQAEGAPARVVALF
jgi:kynurenine formamidase